MPEPRSVAGVAEVIGVSGPAGHERPADLLIEIPHGATRAEQFEALRSRLRGDYPSDLREFFFVNTDAGAPEVALEIARGVADLGGRRVLLLRGLVPRTFVDVNRVLDAPTPDYSRTGLTPGLPDYVTDAEDRALLCDLHETYQAVARAAFEQVCGGGGLALILHSYAPRSIDVGRIDAGVVRALHLAYEPGKYETWPVRPEVEIIDRSSDGELLAPTELVEALENAYAGAGFAVARSVTYRLDPSTSGWVHSSRHRRRVICVEVNRGLVADPFEPFRELRIDPSKAARVAAPAARVLSSFLSR